MFNHKTDRLNYGDLLIPPEDYELSKAVATTYSLDLETLTAATIALGTHERTDSIVSENPIALLHSLQKVSEKIVIFCESGQTKLPNSSSPLLLLLEKMIVPVALPARKGLFPSFHPKTWIIEYEHKNGSKLYRLIILSRNLTFDRSWDVTFMMEGTQKVDESIKSQPLVSFLQYLMGFCKYSASKKQIINSFLKDLNNVHFNLERKEFEDFTICPIGIGHGGFDMTDDPLFQGYPEASSQATFHEMTIMSPFLSKETIEYLNSEKHDLQDTRRRKLFTRRSELQKIKDVASHFDIYTLKDTIIDGESELPEGEEIDPRQQDLHAKLYLRSKYSDNYLYLGSMNASNSGIGRNVEMMIKLKVKRWYLNMDKFYDTLCGGNEKPFEQIDISQLQEAPTDVPEEKELELTLKKLCRIQSKCKIEETGANFSMYLSFNSDVLPSNVEIYPLRAKEIRLPISEKMEFKGLCLSQLSEFFVVNIRGKNCTLKRVIMIPTQGIPEDRDRSIVNEIIRNKKNFFEYVAIALGDDPLRLFGGRSTKAKQTDGKASESPLAPIPALYEKMLKVASEDKKKLLEIDSVMKMIANPAIVPEDFRQMYETFKSAMRLK